MTKYRNEITEEDLFPKPPIINNPLKVQTLPDHTEIDFYLPENIGPVSDFIDFLRAVGDTRQNDNVTIHINSYGGDVVTALNIIDVLKTSPANIVISVEGNCCSAASMIMLAGNEWEIMPHSYIMIHSYSAARFGKRNEINASFEFDKKWLDGTFREIYEKFLTDDEIEKVLAGQDLYFTADECLERLDNYKKADMEKNELVQKIAQKYEKLINKEVEDVLGKYEKEHSKKPAKDEKIKTKITPVK